MFLCKGEDVSGKIRAKTLKHVIILIFSIAIALAISLHFSEKAFAAEALPAAAVEEGEEDTQEEAVPEVQTAGQPEESDKVDAGLYVVSAGDVEQVITNGAEVSGDAEQTDDAATTAGAEKTPDNVQDDDAATAAEAGKEADVQQSDSSSADTGNAILAEKAADTKQAADASTDAGNAAATETAGDAADPDKASEAEKAAVERENAGDTADAETGTTVEAAPEDAGISAAADPAVTKETTGDSASDDSLVKAGETVDPLTYLYECLTYHGDEENPSAYSLRAYTEDGQSIVTPVKDQSPWSTCWGFSAIAASESSILAECYEKWDQLAPGLYEKYGISTFKELCDWLDLSEKHLAWFAFMPEPENGNYPSQAEEGLYANVGTMEGIYNALGSSYYATSVFSRGTGPLEQSRVPYQNNEGELTEGETVVAKDGTVYIKQNYCGPMTETRDLEYACVVPKGMTQESVLALLKGNPAVQERIRKRFEEGVITNTMETELYVDENGKFFSIARVNELYMLQPGSPVIIAYEDEDGRRYEFDPETKTFPGMPKLQKACYDWTVDEDLHYASLVELESSNILPNYTVNNKVNEDSINAIKEELRAGRGVSVSFHADTASPGNTSAAKYINMVNNAWAHYTYRDSESINHGVTIVGYNDNFPRTLFLEGHEPEKDGAWLVKNSWGGGLSTGTNFGNWGIDENGDGIGDGYFWLSYWDHTIDTIETFDFIVENLVSDRAEYDIRQYDLMTSQEPLTFSCEKEANVFTADATTNVREIGVQHSLDDSFITYEIYLLNDDAENPTDGVLLSAGQEYYQYAGYHRIKTSDICIIPAGRRYSVVVTQEKNNESYITVFYDLNKKSVEDREAEGKTGIRSFSKAVVNRGESYVLLNGEWNDWVDFIPAIRQGYVSTVPTVKEDWIDIDNFSIKAYADFIEQDLRAEATEIGSSDAAASVGVADENQAEVDALVSLAQVHGEISNNETAASSFSVRDGYISAEDYDSVVAALIDQSRATGLKVVVSTLEIPEDDLSEEEQSMLLAAAEDKIARYAEISLLVLATDNEEFLGNLHRTDDPVGLAMAIPDELLTSGTTVCVLRLHDGVVERLETRVENGRAYFASDLFSLFALAYDENDASGEPEPAPSEENPAEDNTNIVPVNTGNEEPAKCSVTKTSVQKSPAKQSQAKKVKAAEGRVAAAETGDVSNATLWLMLMVLTVGAAITAVFAKTKRE